METASHALNLATALVLRDMPCAMIIVYLKTQTFLTQTTGSAKARDNASGMMNHAMGPVARDLYFAMTIAYPKTILTQTTGSAKARDNASGMMNHAMELVAGDLYFAMEDACVTHTGGNVDPQDDASGSFNNATLMTVPTEEHHVETACASAKMRTVRGVTTPTTGTIATAPASKIGRHVARLVSLDTIYVKSTKTSLAPINSTVPDA